MEKVLIVFGTRPEAIKMAPVVKIFNNTQEFSSKVCITAQHREMLDQVLEIFKIEPDYDLNIMKKGQDLFDITSEVIKGMKEVLRNYKPDLVLVHGDTTTSTFAALSAFYEQIQVGHVEAGLRTGNIYSPWPEEMNRMITKCLTTLHFSPTNWAKENLLRENVSSKNIIVTGNTVIDALYQVLENIKDDNSLKSNIEDEIIENGFPNINNRKFVLITGHRRENFGEGFINICKSLKDLAIKYADFDFVYPVHLNPNVRKPVYDILERVKNIYLIEPLKYVSFLYAMSKSYLVLTDSGGIQEEAPSLGKPVLVMRDTTERPEGLNAGTVKLVGTDYDRIVGEVSELIDNQDSYIRMSTAHNPYGDGKAADRILDFVKSKI